MVGLVHDQDSGKTFLMAINRVVTQFKQELSSSILPCGRQVEDLPATYWRNSIGLKSRIEDVGECNVERD